MIALIMYRMATVEHLINDPREKRIEKHIVRSLRRGQPLDKMAGPSHYAFTTCGCVVFCMYHHLHHVYYTSTHVGQVRGLTQTQSVQNASSASLIRAPPGTLMGSGWGISSNNMLHIKYSNGKWVGHLPDCTIKKWALQLMLYKHVDH